MTDQTWIFILQNSEEFILALELLICHVLWNGQTVALETSIEFLVLGAVRIQHILCSPNLHTLYIDSTHSSRCCQCPCS